jgi:hypothetical protein
MCGFSLRLRFFECAASCVAVTVTGTMGFAWFSGLEACEEGCAAGIGAIGFVGLG